MPNPIGGSSGSARAALASRAVLGAALRRARQPPRARGGAGRLSGRSLPARRRLRGFGAWPRETVDRLTALDAEWIRGNVDRWLVDAPDAPEAMHDVIERSRELAGRAALPRARRAARVDHSRRHALLPRLAALRHGQLLSRAAGLRRRAADGCRGASASCSATPTSSSCAAARAGSSWSTRAASGIPLRRRPPRRLRDRGRRRGSRAAPGRVRLGGRGARGARPRSATCRRSASSSPVSTCP